MRSRSNGCSACECAEMALVIWTCVSFRHSLASTAGTEGCSAGGRKRTSTPASSARRSALRLFASVVCLISFFSARASW